MSKDIQIVESWEGLKAFGILALTGEACGLSMRILCDLTPQGCQIIEDLFRVNTRDRSNWNYSEGQVASVMLPYGLLDDLAVWCLLTWFPVVLKVSGIQRHTQVIGLTLENAAQYLQELNHLRDHGGEVTWREYRKSAAPGTGFDNQHLFSGRVR